MKITAQLRFQHDELRVLTEELYAQLDAQLSGADERPCREVLARLLGRLNVHLALEDKILYPQLLAHGRQDVARLARRFTDEMGSLGVRVKEFAGRWEAAGSIQARPAAFAEDCRALLSALAQRMERENRELYALSDELGL